MIQEKLECYRIYSNVIDYCRFYRKRQKPPCLQVKLYSYMEILNEHGE